MDEPDSALVIRELDGYMCAGVPGTLQLSARGGHAPYRWLLENEGEFVLESNEGPEATLTGTPALPGAYTLRATVRDACDRETTRDVSVDVRSAPELLQQVLPSGCEEGLYRAVLNVDPTREADRASSVNLPPGLTFDARAALTGVVSVAEPSEFQLTLSNDCGSSSADFTLSVYDKWSCPVQPSSLPAPCRNKHYEVDLELSEEITDWTTLDIPPGLEILPGTRTLSGTSKGPGNLIVKVNIRGEYTVSGFPLGVRDTCWFAHIANDAERNLILFDPVLRNEELQRNLGETKVADHGGVVDFAFAPNGRLLAYVAQGVPFQELIVMNLESWREQSIAFGGDVTHFAWSETGALAVAFGNMGGTFLGGTDTSVLDWDSAGFPATPTFVPVAARVDGNLSWVGTDFVAFTRAGSDPNRSTVQIAHRRSDMGFSPPAAVGPEYVRPIFQPTGRGLFVTDWRDAGFAPSGDPNARIDFILPAANPLADHSLFQRHRDEIVAPEGSLSGRASEGGFVLFEPAVDTLNQSPTPWARVPTCTKFLAWARNGRRVACVNEPIVSGEAGELWIYDIDAVDVSGRIVAGVTSYSVEASNASRRGFSPSGDWFAYVTDRGLTVVDASETGLRPAYLIADARGAIDFEFSPDERVLLVQRPDLWVQAFSLDSESSTTFAEAPVLRCAEEYVHAPRQWCGRTAGASGFLWSPIETIVAFQNVAGMLYVSDVSAANVGSSALVFLGESTSFAFQPQNSSTEGTDHAQGPHRTQISTHR